MKFFRSRLLKNAFDRNNLIPVILSESEQRERESKDPGKLSLAHAVSRRSHETSQFVFESLERSQAYKRIFQRPTWPSKVVLCLLAILCIALAAWASMPAWMQGIDSRSALETAVFRSVPLLGIQVSIRRPPAESIPALSELIKSQPHPEELYSLRAMQEEQALDFKAAETDWKLYLQNSPARPAAQLALADFYHRRHRPLDEINALSALGRMPASPAEKFTAVSDQQSWKAFERIFRVIQSQALNKAVSTEQYKVWIQRYPQEQAVYSRYFEFLLAQKNFLAAQQLIFSYQHSFPQDQIFLTKARALLAYKRGDIEQGLAVYARNFQPLWPDELIKNYFDLLSETNNLRSFLQQAHKALEQNPDDLSAAARIFHYYSHAGDIEAAEQSLTEYRLKKESRGASWTAQELYTFARLLENSRRYPEAARYYFALYNSGDEKSAEQALVGLTNIMLNAPEEQIRFGAADLSLYRNIATMDSGPGYLNGILSLILNDSNADEQYIKEEGRAVAYFHRSRAAALVALLDQHFPKSEARAELHARLIDAYDGYGEQDAVLRLGNEFLAAFPQAEQRTKISLLMANVYAVKGDHKNEFALYDALLKELAAKAEGMPLGEDVSGTARVQRETAEDEYHDAAGNNFSARDDRNDDSDNDEKKPEKQAFALSTQASAQTRGARSPEYEHVLNEYLSRLAQQNAIPHSLVILRRELDRNPDDPGLYERCARFLEQNGLGTEQEAIYKRAIQKFPGTSWYQKLARWYLRHNRENDFQQLTNQVADIFSGTELQAYFQQIWVPSSLSIAIERYAHQRFPHNLEFVHNLLDQYVIHGQMTEWEALLRQYWFEDEQLRNMFFEYLSRTGRLNAELEQLEKQEHVGQTTWPEVARANPAAATFVAEAQLWKSHFEQAATPLGAVAVLYPADVSVGREASSVYRSLAYFRPINTTRAVRIELNLLQANPLNRDTLARIGDIYSDRSQFALAAPYWNRMPQTEPGNPSSYEESATIFWDYYMFDDALRLLEKGRTRLKDNTLYSYQAGAIYENKRDYARAVAEYVKGALANGGEESPERSRLLQLAARRSASAQVDAATAKAVTESGFTFAAIRLRTDVLQTQFHPQEIAPFLDSLVPRIDSPEILEKMDGLATQRALNNVHCHILEREAALSSDPVRKMQLQYELAGFYESQKDLPAAQQNIESLYQQNPRILGVMRATVDFYWRNKDQKKAIAVLQKAAADSYPELRASLNYEAARKMTEAGEYVQARKILAGLLQQSANNADYLAAFADTYARAGDNAGLRDFYVERIADLRHANLPPAERKTRIAGLRRGLVPALTALKDYPGAVDQYIELINAYPEDESVSSEAALYAVRHGRTAQIVNFYKKTVTDSPQDSRWAVVLARLQTATEDYPAAIQAYSQAINIRPDRPDLLAARAGLEERLLHFDEAAADYTTLYELTYHDPAWMEKEAEVRARQNQPELAVKALETAFVIGRSSSPGAYFAVAERLEDWGLLSQARIQAEKGLDAAGNDLLANRGNHSYARLYVRIMTRLRMQEAAYERLERAIQDAGILPPWTIDAGQKGMDPVAEKEWQQSTLNWRNSNASDGMVACMEEMGATVSRYFTPEQKEQFLQFVEKKNSQISRQEARTYLLPLSRGAELADLQARLTVQALLNMPHDSSDVYARLATINDLTDLQTRRLHLAELGQQLEEMASKWKGHNACSKNSSYCLQLASDIFHLAGKPEDELRTLDQARDWNALGPRQHERYFELLLASNPQKLVELASQNDDQGNAGAEFLLARGQARLVQQAIDARRNERPVWKHAYTALAGLYFNDSSPRIKSAFLAALADQTIGQRMKNEGDPDRVLAGDEWFYYASRYGELMELTGNHNAEEFLSGELEHAPDDADAYFETASIFQDYEDWLHAVEDYQHVLELSPARVDAHQRLAEIYWKQQKKEAAVQELKLAVEALKNKVRSAAGMQRARSLRDFKDDFVDVADQAKVMGMQQEFSGELKGILQNYIKLNGNAYVVAMLPAAMAGPQNPQAVTNFVLELSRSSSSPTAFLEQFVETKRLKLEREPVLRRLVEILRDQAHNRKGNEPDYEESDRRQWEIKWMEALLQTKQYDRVREELHVASKSLSDDDQSSLLSIELRLAAATGKLDAVLAAYAADASQAPSGESLQTVARRIQELGDKAAAQKILEFVYQREIDQHQFTVAGMAGLAEIRMDAGDFPAGLELLRRMTLVAGAPFEAQGPAAELLMRKGHAVEAIGFLQQLVTAMPWNAEYRVRLAQARLAAGQEVELARRELTAVAQDAKAAYQVRVTAAGALAGSVKTDLGSRELNLIAAGVAPTPADANQHFFYTARLNAAAHADEASRTTLLRAALEDYPSADAPRLPLLRAAIKTGDFHLAIAAMKPYLHNQWLDLNSSNSYWYQNYYDDAENNDDDDDAADAQDESGWDDAVTADSEFTSWQGLENRDKVEIYELVGRAFQRLGAPDDALSSFNQAQNLHPSPAVAKQLKAEIREVSKVLAQQREDLQRRPSFRDEVQQARTVRPRVPPIKPKAGTAGVQGGQQ